MNLYEYLDEIEKIGSTTEKQAMIEAAIKEFPEAEQFFRITFNGVVYGVDEKAFYNAFTTLENSDTIHAHVSNFLSSILTGIEYSTISGFENFCNDLEKKSGQEQLDLIFHYFNYLNPTQAKWFCRAILHDLRMGANLKTINKAFRALNKPIIEKYDVQLAEKVNIYTDDFELPAAVERKYDGIRIQATVCNGEVLLLSRRGKDRTDDYPDIVLALKRIWSKEEFVILDGEIVMHTGSETNENFQDMMKKGIEGTRKYVVFDLLIQEGLDYIHRWDNLVNLFCSKSAFLISGPQVVLAEHYDISTREELIDYFEDVTQRRNLEGVMIKFYNRPYKRGSRSNMLKCKPDYVEGKNEADLLCIGWNPGTGKYAGQIGSLKLQDKSGKIKVDVGSGITDDWREILTAENDKLIGSIIMIKYNSKTDTGSLRFPRFIARRSCTDKDEADEL